MTKRAVGEPVGLLGGGVIGGGWAALVNGAGGVTPYYKSRFDFMAKLTYNQSYHLHEAR